MIPAGRLVDQPIEVTFDADVLELEDGDRVELAVLVAAVVDSAGETHVTPAFAGAKLTGASWLTLEKIAEGLEAQARTYRAAAMLAHASDVTRRPAKASA